jgi:uncharacterized RDD family membrane protein YckC
VSAPEKLTIDTPEQVPLEFVLASVGSRFLAFALDTLFQLGGFVLLVLIALGVSAVSAVLSLDSAVWVLAGLILTAFVVYYGYFAAFEALWNGQTPGKRMVGLRVILVTGRPITAYESILRNVVRLVDQLPAMYATGILSILLTAKNQRLGDLAAATVVVYERPTEARDMLAVPDHAILPGNAGRTRHGAARLTDDEIGLVDAFLRRRSDLDVYRRAATARQIATRLRARLPDAAVLEDEVFLEEILAEFRTLQPYR